MHDYRDDAHAGDQKEDAEDVACPICIEPFDAQDQRFVACPCNYRVCMFCVRRIRTEFDGRCPGCRRDYKEENFRYLNAEDRFTRGRKAANPRISNGADNSGSNSYHSSNTRGQRNSEKYHRRAGSNTGTSAASSGKYEYSEEGLGYGDNAEDGTSSQGARVNMKDLANVRVVQDNLVYLIGLAPSIAREDVLRSNRFFGQYGRIIKVVVSRSANSDRSGNHGYNNNHNNRSPSSSAYITFSRAEDAKAAIQAVNGFWIDNQMIRASYGTTKYCNMFLRHLPCNNPECLYLHKLGDESSSFTKEQMQQAGRSQFQEPPQIAMEPPGLDGRDENTSLPTRGLSVSDFLQTAKHDSTGAQANAAPAKLNGNSLNTATHNTTSASASASASPSASASGATSAARSSTNVWGNKSRISSLAGATAAAAPVANGTTGWSASSSTLLKSAVNSPDQDKPRTLPNAGADDSIPSLSRSKSANPTLQTNVSQQSQQSGRSSIVYDSLSQETKEPVKRVDGEEKAGNSQPSKSLLSTLGGIELSAYNKQHQISDNRTLRTISPIGYPIHAESPRLDGTELNAPAANKSFRQPDPRLYGLKDSKNAVVEDGWLQTNAVGSRLSGEASVMDFNVSSLLQPVEGEPFTEDSFGMSRPQGQAKGRLWEGSGVTGKLGDSYSNTHAHTSSTIRDGQTLPGMGRAHLLQQQQQQQQPKFHILSNVHRGKGVQQKGPQGTHAAQSSRNRYGNAQNGFPE